MKLIGLIVAYLRIARRVAANARLIAENNREIAANSKPIAEWRRNWNSRVPFPPADVARAWDEAERRAARLFPQFQEVDSGR